MALQKPPPFWLALSEFHQKSASNSKALSISPLPAISDIRLHPRNSIKGVDE
jgi:hypothetical protein